VPARPPRTTSTLVRLTPDQVEVSFRVPAVASTAIAGADGSLWIASADDTLLRIDSTNGHVQARRTLDAYPQGLAALGGLVWALEPGELQAVDVRTNRLVRRVEAPQRPTAIASGGGALWLAGPGGVERFNPAFNAHVQVEAAPDRSPAPVAVVFGAGSAWVLHPCATAAGPSTLRRYDGGSGRAAARISVPGCPSMMAFAYTGVQVSGSDGTVDLVEAATDVVSSRHYVGVFLGGPTTILVSGGFGNTPDGLTEGVVAVDGRDGVLANIELYPRNGMTFDGTVLLRTPVSAATIAFGALWVIEP
jgi:hypothetical protein